MVVERVIRGHSPAHVVRPRFRPARLVRHCRLFRRSGTDAPRGPGKRASDGQDVLAGLRRHLGPSRPQQAAGFSGIHHDGRSLAGP